MTREQDGRFRGDRILIQGCMWAALILCVAGIASATPSMTADDMTAEMQNSQGGSPAQAASPAHASVACIVNACPSTPAGESSPNGIRLALVRGESCVSIMDAATRRPAIGGEAELPGVEKNPSRGGTGVFSTGGGASPAAGGSIDPMLLSAGERVWGSNL